MKMTNNDPVSFKKILYKITTTKLGNTTNPKKLFIFKNNVD